MVKGPKIHSFDSFLQVGPQNLVFTAVLNISKAKGIYYDLLSKPKQIIVSTCNFVNLRKTLLSTDKKD